MSLTNRTMFTATLAGKREEPPSLPSSSSEASLLLISTSSFSPTFPLSSTSYITALPLSNMPSKNPRIPINDENSAEHETNENENDLPSSPVHHRRLPLPTKLSFEQNITNLLEKESPLLQSELLTAEHELSVLRSRMAVNEGVTAVTGSILESLKEQFNSPYKIDQQSSASQTSPSLESLPDTLEIHYDAESPKSPFFIVKATNSFWLARPLTNSEVENHLKKFSSPIMKRAQIKIPDDLDLDDIDKDSISDDDDILPIDRQEQLSEMKTIRSSSLRQQIDYFERFDDKLDELYSSIDYLKHNRLTQTSLNHLEKTLEELKSLMHNIQFTKENELRLEYEFDELENLFDQTLKHGDYYFIELFEQNLNELQRIFEQIKSHDSQRDLITEFEDKLEIIESKSKPSSYQRLIPENPVVTNDVFFEGNKIRREKKPAPRLIPEDPQINASSFYEGDIHRSFYPHPQPSEYEKKILIPEKPLVSSEVFYEGDPQRSMFIERPNIFQMDTSVSSPPIYIENLREIMGDLMLAASWSKRPPRVEKQATKEDVEVHAESFLTREEQDQTTPRCEIIHEIEDFSSDAIEPNEDDQVSPDVTLVVVSPSSFEREDEEDEENDKVLHETSDRIVQQAINDAVTEEENYLYYQAAVKIVNEAIEHVLNNHDEELNATKSPSSSSSSSSDDEEDREEKYSSSDDEENQKLIPRIADQPYLLVTDVVTSNSTQELGNLVQELQVLENQIPDIRPRLSSSSSSSSSGSSEDNENPPLDLSVPTITTTKSVTELTNLVSEFQDIEEQLADRLDLSEQPIASPMSSKSFNELGGLINELKTVTNRIHQELFTSNNIDSLSQDIVKYRRDSQPIPADCFLQETDQYQAVDEMINQILQEAQEILLAESSSSSSPPQRTVKPVPTIVVERRHVPYHQSSITSISDDVDLAHDDNTGDRIFELTAQLDYLRRMSRYENLMEQHEQAEQTYLKLTQNNNENDDENSSNPHSTESLNYHSMEDKSITIEILPAQHFQSAHDLHDEEKSKLVRSPELYNLGNATKQDHRSLLTNSQIQYRTLSESALAVDDSKRHSLATSNDASVEFLTTISKENSMEVLQQSPRLPTPFDDVLEKESSPEHSDSYNIPTSAFSDAFEPTSSCQRPLLFSKPGQPRLISDADYETVAHGLVHQVLVNVVSELTAEQDDSSMSNKSDHSSSSDESDELREEDEEELSIEKTRPIDEDLSNTKASIRSSLSKVLRRAQTDTEHFDITPSPIQLKPPLIRRNSQSDTESYFRAVSPSVQEYTPLDHSSSDEKCAPKSRYLLPRETERYSGEGEESSGGNERTVQRRKRSTDVTNTHESPSIKNIAFKFENNENFHRQESLDSPMIDSNENFILRTLQEGILRINLESSQTDLKFVDQDEEILEEKTYSSTSKKALPYDDYDGGSENDDDESKFIPSQTKSSDLNIKLLLDELVESIHDDASISSQSDATTVILKSDKTSLDEEETLPSRSLTSSHSVIYQQDNTQSFEKKQSFSNPELIDCNSKNTFRSYPGSSVPSDIYFPNVNNIKW